MWVQPRLLSNWSLVWSSCPKPGHVSGRTEPFLGSGAYSLCRGRERRCLWVRSWSHRRQRMIRWLSCGAEIIDSFECVIRLVKTAKNINLDPCNKSKNRKFICFLCTQGRRQWQRFSNQDVWGNLGRCNSLLQSSCFFAWTFKLSISVRSCMNLIDSCCFS